MQKPQAKKPKPTDSPNHLKHLSNTLKTFQSKALGHPLLVPPAPPTDSSGQQDNQLVPASSGEYIIPADVVKRKGTQFFDNLVKKTLEEVLPPQDASTGAMQGGTGTPQTGFRWGGEVDFGDRFGEGFHSGPSFMPRGVTNYQDAVDQHPNFWNDPGGGSGGRRGWPSMTPEMQQQRLDLLDQYGRTGNWLFQTSMNNPWLNPNYMGQGPSVNNPYGGPNTQIPTFFDSQGYPFAVPVFSPEPQGPDYNVNPAQERHIAPRHNQ